VGLLSVQLLKAQGCRVMGVDLDRWKGELARELGADLVLVPGEDNVEEAAANFTGGIGADAVLITAASQDRGPILLAEAVARERARLVLVGEAELALTRKIFWTKELSFSVSKAAGPGSLAPLYEGKGFDYPVGYVRWTEGRNLAAFLDLVAQGKVRVDRLITHRFSIGEALPAYDLILQNREPYLGVLLTYPQEEVAPPTRTVRLKPVEVQPEAGDCRSVGLIGGGLFTKNILMPVVKQIKGVKLLGAATTTGATSQHLAKKYGFAYATTDYRELLQDPAIGSIIITTRHHSHCRLVLEALKAGKHVFVEKPLCLTEGELAEIRAAYDGSRLLMVGFNRRFAALAQQVKTFVAARSTPLVMLYRVNAGFIPDDSWVHDPGSGGGRLLGEVCHFVDFLQFLCGSRPVQVNVAPIAGALGKYRADDNFILNLRFADGSIGTIVYTAKGSKAFSRERLEVFCEESAAVVEDFRRARFVQGGKVRNERKFSMDMGYRAELEFFFHTSGKLQNFNPLWEQYAASTLGSLKAQEALLTGRTIEW
jgi:predicted dehydrogenase